MTPTRQTEEDVRGIFGHIHELLISKKITNFIRWISFFISISMFFLGYGPLFQGNSIAYQRPVFDGVFAFASPVAWGVGFMTPAALLLVGAISGRAIIYLTGTVIGTVTLAGWSSMIMFEAWISEEAILTSGAIGLYLGTFTAICGLAASPDQIARVKPIVAVVKEGEDPIKLRRIG